MSPKPQTDVRIIVNGNELSNWVRYEIESDLLTPSDAFSFTARNPKGELAGTIKKHHEVTVLLDGTVQMSGYVDDVNWSVGEEGSEVEIVGRDRFAFLVDCDAKPRSYHNVDLLTLAKSLSRNYISGRDWVLEWEVHNEKNREALQAAGRKLRKWTKLKNFADNIFASGIVPDDTPNKSLFTSGAFLDNRVEDALEKARANYNKIKKNVFFSDKVEPGEKCFEVLARNAKKIGLLVWCACDGVGIIAAPNYDQSPLYELMLYPKDDARNFKNNLTRLQISESGREQFSHYRFVATKGNTKDDDANNSRYEHSIADNDFPEVHPGKPMIATGSAQNRNEAKKHAEWEKQQRLFNALSFECVTRGHRNNGYLWQPDSIVALDSPMTGHKGTYYLTRRRFVGDESGQSTLVTLHPKGLLLV